MDELSEFCTCLVGQFFKVADPWCPVHKQVMDLSGFVSIPEQENE